MPPYRNFGGGQNPGKEPRDKFAEYSARQKAFWNVADEDVARFERVYFEDEATWTNQEQREARWNASAERAVEVVLREIEAKPDWTILEIGCGVGRLLEKVRGRVPFRRLIGVDISESMIGFAHRRLGQDQRIELLVNNGHALPMIEDNSVDFAYSVDVFTHIFDIDVALAYLKELHRILRQGRQFRFNVRRFDPDTAFGNSWGGRLARLMYKSGAWSSGFHRWAPSEPAEFNGNAYTARDLKRMIAASGLKAVDISILEARYWALVERR